MQESEEGTVYCPARGSVIAEILESVVEQAMSDGQSEDAATQAAVQAYFATQGDRLRSYVRSLHQTKNEIFEEHERQREFLEQEVDDRYGNAFRTYKAASVAAYELGANLHEDYVTSGAADNFSPACQILFLLHGRACTVAAEVLHLLRGGFADGANARHRTLHELAVTCDTFTSSMSDELAERYIAYSEVERYKDMYTYQEHCTDIGYEPYTAEELADAEECYNAAISKYGKGFRRRNQWAAPLFDPGVDITITALESLVGVSHKRPFYMNANHQIHAGPRAALLNLKRRGVISYIGVGARSDEDIGEVAHGTLIYLLHCTACLMSRLHQDVDPNPDDILGIEAMHDLVADAGKAFFRASRRLT